MHILTSQEWIDRQNMPAPKLGEGPQREADCPNCGRSSKLASTVTCWYCKTKLKIDNYSYVTSLWSFKS